MKADLAARNIEKNFEPGKPSLSWRTIRDYHRAAFQNVAHLPPQAWTAWIPLLIVGEGGGEGLWRRMLTADILSVGVETAGLALQRLAREAGVLTELEHTVVALLKVAPPLALGVPPYDPGVERCLARLADQRLQSRPGAPGETLAFFYLDCLAQGAHTPPPPFLIDMAPSAPFHLDPFGPSWRPTMGDYARGLRP